MGLLEIILLAIALSVDACVVSFSYGLVSENRKRFNSTLLAVVTGFFQFFMPILGYYFAQFLHQYIQEYAKLIVFVIFVYLGVKFIKESFETKCPKKCCLGIGCVFLIGIATAIDAFSAGISLMLCGNKILLPSLLIGAITFFNSLFGFWCGVILKKFTAKYLEILGGLILIGLGIKALF